MVPKLALSYNLGRIIGRSHFFPRAQPSSLSRPPPPPRRPPPAAEEDEEQDKAAGPPPAGRAAAPAPGQGLESAWICRVWRRRAGLCPGTPRPVWSRSPELRGARRGPRPPPPRPGPGRPLLLSASGEPPHQAPSPSASHQPAAPQARRASRPAKPSQPSPWRGPSTPTQ